MNGELLCKKKEKFAFKLKNSDAIYNWRVIEIYYSISLVLMKTDEGMRTLIGADVYQNELFRIQDLILLQLQISTNYLNYCNISNEYLTNIFRSGKCVRLTLQNFYCWC